jgi:hypothetical protein
MGDQDGERVQAGIVDRVVGWLRAGYPDGLPDGDYVALYGILRRTLTPSELDRVLALLAADARRAAESGGEIGAAEVRQRMEQMLLGPALPEDVSRVAGRLASAGWPLGSPDTPAPTEARTGLVARIVAWLRAGYPTGLPERDYIPLVALLRRRLTDEEVASVSAELASDGALPPTRVDVGAAIAAVTSELPSEEDIARVREYLDAHGWPSDFAV